MATIKSYTDLSQSKTLSKILPLESADMYYMETSCNNYTIGVIQRIERDMLLKQAEYYKMFPCWSLAVLLGVLPKGTNISTPKPVNELSYCCWNQYDEIYADNPVDACYEIILRLHELNLL